MIHCSGGGQTKVLHFIDNLRIVKDNLFSPPPLFQIIQNESGNSLKEMYKVFNMGHRMELYVPENRVNDVIQISESFGVSAQQIGYCEASNQKEVIIKTQNTIISYP
jgi:phosphoribosylformylglycinamidine cyclo-ligase